MKVAGAIAGLSTPETTTNTTVDTTGLSTPVQVAATTDTTVSDLPLEDKPGDFEDVLVTLDLLDDPIPSPEHVEALAKSQSKERSLMVSTVILLVCVPFFI
jgi:hypothetical protein